MKRLSVCMIVKNEEAVLGRCLESVKEIADEIIIIDTGSTDQTKEIAGQYTGLIYDYEWNNDFAAARNASLSYATGKWILVLDADEYLPSNQIKEWKKFLNNVVPENNIAYTLLIVNLSDEDSNHVTTGPVTRLFPNYKGICYSNPIHEQLTGTKDKLYQKKLNLNIYHTGYQSDTMASKNKHERNMAIFEHMQSTGEMSAYDYFTLGNQYVFSKNFSEAIEAYEKSIKLNNTNTSMWYPFCVLGLIGIYLNHNQLNKSWALVETQLINFLEFPEYHAMKGLHLEALGFKEEAYECYKEAINRAEKLAVVQTDFWLVNPDFGFEVPVTQLMNLSFQMERSNEAMYWMTRLLQRNNKDTKTVVRLLEWLSQHESEQSIIDFLNQLYNLKDTGDSIFLYKITLALGLKELTRYYSKFVPHNLKLNYADQARLALIEDDYTGWDFNSDQMEPSDDVNAWLQVALGSLIWNHKKAFGEKYFTELNTLLFKLMDGTEVEAEQLNKHAKELFLIAKNLFLQRRFELFDHFVTLASNPELINMLANYFYNLKLHDLAMKYYSVLLSQGELNVLSYENLGMYHANHQYSEETVEFLSEVLKLAPEKRQLYPVLLKHIKDQKIRKQFTGKYKDQFPELLSISFVEQFLHKKNVMGAGV